MARKWQAIICYEDRSDHLTTSRWRLSGVATKEGAQNTDDGDLWLKTTKSGDDVTADLYKDDACASGNKVATGTADVSGCDNTGANAAELTLTAAESSGLSGSFWIHNYEGDDTCGVKVALCTDEDLGALWDGIEALTGYDATNGCAEFIRVAGEEILGLLTQRFREQLGGHGAKEAWFITDAERLLPDLRRIANPDQVRLACAHRALAIAIGRSHQLADPTMFSELQNRHNAECESAMASLVLAIKAGSGDDASESKSPTSVSQSRV